MRRTNRTNFKAGNIMNFLDQHGDGYDFMLVLDADSVMLGKSIERLIRTLQERPRMGILQTLMIPIRSATPFARAMQYSTARCLPLYAKGMLWFYDRDSVYWGHNALIRVAPFREHCRLPTLPGQPPLGGTIMSQDIVEAAFLGRAGWEVGWIVEGGGSFDELPANILTYGQRDRRWCQGNFQHYRFILAPGHPVRPPVLLRQRHLLVPGQPVAAVADSSRLDRRPAWAPSQRLIRGCCGRRWACSGSKC